jgi:hypothetical protein
VAAGGGRAVKLPVTFRTLGAPITIREKVIDGLGCFDAAAGVVTLHPGQDAVGKLIALIHEALHVGESALKHEIDHDYIEGASFGVAVLLIQAGAIDGITVVDLNRFMREQSAKEGRS